MRKPYGEVLDEMDHEAKYLPASDVGDLIRETIITMRHARIFIMSREKMHPTGVQLYDELLAKLAASPLPSDTSKEVRDMSDDDYEKELFAAVNKTDLAEAIKHIRDWRLYIDHHHRHKYADLIEAQGKLIAWLLSERTTLGRMREPTEVLEQAKKSIIAALIGSCDCNTKSPEAVHHMGHCRYLKLLMALDCIDAALKEAADER